IWVAQLLLCVGLSLIFTFMWLRTKGSVGVAVLFHGAINGWAATFENAWLPELDDLSIWQIARILIFVAIGLVLCFFHWSKPAKELN
ncbi:MAG: hypothetical protein RLN72_09645, partial [Henriciella sp.]